MSMTDPIADLLTRVRNATSAGHRSVDVPASKLKREIARVLAEERFIDNFAYYDDGKQGQLRLYLRYTAANDSIIQGLRRMSKPGLRRYAAKSDLPRVRRGLGVAIVSTSRGVMTDRDARRTGVGGEVLCSVW
jgi:small subunit ribosomal protein S8